MHTMQYRGNISSTCSRMITMQHGDKFSMSKFATTTMCYPLRKGLINSSCWTVRTIIDIISHPLKKLVSRRLPTNPAVHKHGEDVVD